MTLRLISHHECREHMPGENHPEAPSRMSAINDALIASGLESFIRYYDAPVIEKKYLLQVHTENYINQLIQLVHEDGTVYLDDGDTSIGPGTLRSAFRAAGAGIMGVDLLMEHPMDPVFCLIRPPGHHAKKDEAMGFCIFNNVAVAARYALSKPGINRVMILDFDVHHGNGTESIFQNDHRVFFLSTFQHPFYPWSEEKSPYNNMCFYPLSPGSTGKDLETIVKEHWIPKIIDFNPNLLIISAGFDGHKDDPTADLLFVENNYFEISKFIRKASIELGHGRVLSMLEGGYEPGALGRSVVAHLRGLTFY